MKPLSEMKPYEVDGLAKQSVQARCNHIIDEFDEWLAVRVLRLKLQHADLPQLNDTFRDYFSDTRSARTPGGSQ